MISEAYLQRVCGAAALNRARTLVARGAVRERSCQYARSLTQIDAHVASQTARGVSYWTSANLDEERGVITSCSCTCPVGISGGVVCKHVAALVLDFNRYASYYPGYSEQRYVSTTSCIADFLQSQSERDLGALSLQEDTPSNDVAQASVDLELTLVRDGAYWDARFRVVSPQAAYVMKDIESFCDAVSSHEYVRYGKKLAFTHELGMFTDQAQQVVQFLQRAVAARLAGTRGGYGWIYASQRVGRDLPLSHIELADLVDLYAGRSVFLDDGEHFGEKPHAVRVVDGDPVVGVELKPASGDSYEIVRTGNASFIDCGGRLLAWDENKLYRCSTRLAQAAGFLTQVYDNPAKQLLVSKRDTGRFAAVALPQLEEALGVTAPAELEALKPIPCQLEFYLDRTRAGVTCDARAVYGEHTFDLLAGESSSSQGTLIRDEAHEGSGLKVLARYFPDIAQRRSDGLGGPALIPSSDDNALASLVLEGTTELSRVGQVFTTPAFDRLSSTRAPSVHIGVSIKSGLLDLSVEAQDLPQDELFALLGSYRRRRRYHRLRDGSFLDMSKLDLSELGDLADELGLTRAQLASGEIEVPSYRAFLLDDVLDESEKDISFEDYLDNFREIDPSIYQVPQQLVGTLRPYQVEGYRWLSSLADMGFGGILADEMGLGKSVQLIALLLARRKEAHDVGPSLIVCPASLVYNWEAEFARFAPELDVAVVSGSARQRQLVRDQEDHEVLITSYDLLRRDIEDYAHMSFWSETLDEAQYVKNHGTLAARAVRRVSARHRFALTGTPVENRLSELWSILDFLMPGLLGSYQSFKQRYEQPIVGGDEKAAARLRAAVRPFILRRLKADVLDDLPDKLENVVFAHMEEEQERLYRAHEQELRLALAKQTDKAFETGKLQILAELTKLRQICCDPRLLYDNYEGGSAKLETIIELVRGAQDSDQKALIFSQFTSFLDLIGNRLSDEGVSFYRIDGSTPKRRRLDLVNAFNANDVPVFLISLKAGGTGLNLTGASVVIHADPWWNEAAQNQATDRAHRIGQTRDVSVYKVIAKGTIEERIVKLQEAKRGLAEAVMGAENASVAKLSKEDLIELLS